MTWKEFKARVEASGVSDADEVEINAVFSGDDIIEVYFDNDIAVIDGASS